MPRALREAFVQGAPLPFYVDRETIFLYADAESEDGRTAMALLAASGMAWAHLPVTGGIVVARRWAGAWIGLSAIRELVVK